MNVPYRELLYYYYIKNESIPLLQFNFNYKRTLSSLIKRLINFFIKVINSI
jgi:hypothetical protein